MALNYIAELLLPPIVPTIEASIGLPAIAINAALQGSLSLNASLEVSPPTVGVYIAALAEIEAQISAAIGLGLPSVSFTFSDTVTLIASLEAAFSILLTLEGLLNAAIGMYAFTYNGVASGMGAAVTTELATVWPDGAPTNTATNAMIFGAVSSVAQTQIADFMDGLTVGSGLVYTAKMSAISQLSIVTALAAGQGAAGIQYQLDLALKLQASLQLTPPTLAVTLDALLKFSAYLKATIALGPPSVSAAISATASLSAKLSAQFSLLIRLDALLSSPGAFFCYTYSGLGNAMGAALTTALASTWGDGVTPTTGICVAPILAATDSFTFSIMSGFFAGL
jgi:hypothetical protein